jgi:hypothetical protein
MTKVYRDCTNEIIAQDYVIVTNRGSVTVCTQNGTLLMMYQEGACNDVFIGTKRHRVDALHNYSLEYTAKNKLKDFEICWSHRLDLAPTIEETLAQAQTFLNDEFERYEDEGRTFTIL